MIWTGFKDSNGVFHYAQICGVTKCADGSLFVRDETGKVFDVPAGADADYIDRLLGDVCRAAIVSATKGKQL